MFKRGQNEPAVEDSRTEATQARPKERPRQEPPPPAPDRGRPSYGQAVIGRSIVVKGEISGQEDLTIEGRVEGKVNLPRQHVVIGTSCMVQAEVAAEVVTIEGEIVGNIAASDKVVLTRDGSLTGDIKAARLSVEEGAYLKGTVELAPRKEAQISQPPKTKPAPPVPPKAPTPASPQKDPSKG